MPKPTQKPGVPLWVSGTVNKRSMTRLAKFGNGWIPWGEDAINISNGVESMREAVSALGRDPSSIAVVGTLPIVREEVTINIEATMENVPSLVASGVTDFRAYLPIPTGVEEATDYLSGVVQRFNEVI